MSSKTRVLVVDDSRLIRVAARRILGKEFEVHEAEDGEVAWQIVRDNPSIDLVMSDLTMPNLDGLGLLERIRQSDEHRVRTLPVIIASGAEDDDGSKEKALASGADSFIIKPFDATQLTANVNSLVEHRRTAEALEQSRVANQALQSRVGTDELTGFATESAFRRRGEEQLAFAIRHQKHMALIGIRLDKYRVLYLRQGKEFAQQMLKQVAEMVATERRREDIVARIEPADILLLLPACNGANAHRVAEKFLGTLGRRVLRIDGESVPVSVSIGIACPTLSPGLSFEALVEDLNNSLKTAHQAGGNQIHTPLAPPVSPPVDTSPPEKVSIVTEALLALRLHKPVQYDPDRLVRTLFPLLEYWARGKDPRITEALHRIREAAFGTEATAETRSEAETAGRLHDPVE